jgi:hypothetical protein
MFCVSTRRLVQSIEMNFEREPEEAEEGGEGGGQSPRSLRSDTSIGLVWNKKTGLRVRFRIPVPISQPVPVAPTPKTPGNQNR